MEKLHIEPRSACRTVRHAGNEALRIFYPVIRGDTPAAAHTAALIEALLAYGESALAKTAAQALLSAANEGRLFDFACHTYQITAKAEKRAHHTKVTLIAQHTAGNTVSPPHTLTMYWDQNETLQCKRPPRRSTEKFYLFLLRAREKYVKI